MKRKHFAEIGQQFGRLTVAGPEVRKVTPGDPGGRPAVLCRCDCGRERLVLIKSLVSGRTVSCGHHGLPSMAVLEHLVEINRSPEGRARSSAIARSPEHRAKLLAWARTDEGQAHMDKLAKSPKRLASVVAHGLSYHPEYHTWVSMIHRCHNPDYYNYPGYGGRGIRVCDEWREDVGAFLAWIDEHLGLRPEGRSLDRINNDGNYEPGNVRWATRSEQACNRRRPRRRSVPAAGEPAGTE